MTSEIEDTRFHPNVITDNGPYVLPFQVPIVDHPYGVPFDFQGVENLDSLMVCLFEGRSAGEAVAETRSLLNSFDEISYMRDLIESTEGYANQRAFFDKYADSIDRTEFVLRQLSVQLASQKAPYLGTYSPN
jgi:hypothetical protein|tara:strand:- start:344 stop:739 length:396 start_codon:yes stop_codon:yes gene_type:complete